MSDEARAIGASRKSADAGRHDLQHRIRATSTGPMAQARPLFVQALLPAIDRAWNEGVIFPVEALAAVAAQHGDAARAAVLLGAAATLREESGLGGQVVESDRLARTRRGRDSSRRGCISCCIRARQSTRLAAGCRRSAARRVSLSRPKRGSFETIPHACLVEPEIGLITGSVRRDSRRDSEHPKRPRTRWATTS